MTKNKLPIVAKQGNDYFILTESMPCEKCEHWSDDLSYLNIQAAVDLILKEERKKVREIIKKIKMNYDENHCYQVHEALNELKKRLGI